MKMTDIELIEEFRKAFDYKEGKLYWKEGRKIGGKEAGSNSKGGYLQVNVLLSTGEKLKFANHRIIFAFHNGWFPDLIDHKDRNPRNNYPDNLRAADKRINSINTGLQSNNTSGIKGVNLDKRRVKWRAQIRAEKKNMHLGYFDTKEEAIAARVAAEKIYHNTNE